MASVVAVHSDLTAPTNVVRRVMAKHPELFLIVIGLSLTIISRYGSSSFFFSLKPKPITVPPKPPKKFFPNNSPVYDFFNGELDPVVRLLAQEELIFLMYYAPWCSRSMAIRWEFHKAARHMQGRVKFVAVNCWWPDGQCRKRYKFLMFPVLFVYHTHLDGFRYLGEMAAEHMVTFVEDITYPITAFYSHDQVKSFVAKHDSAVVGYFDLNASPQPPGYQQFYFASMRMLEQDPYNQIKFCIFPRKSLAESYNLTQSNDVALLRVANSTLKYPRDFNLTSSQLVMWSLQNRQKPMVRSLAPLGVKSLILSKEMAQAPAVIAFYALNPLFDTNQPYHVMKDLALQYHNCEEIHNLEDAISHWRSQVRSAQVQYHQVVEFCANYRKQRNVGLYDFKCCVSLASNTIAETPTRAQNICEYCIHRPTQMGPGCSSIDIDPQVEEWTMVQTNFCRNSIDNYNVNEYHSLCCQWCHDDTASVVPISDFLPMSFRSGKRRVTDRYVWQEIEDKPKRLCKKLTLQKLQGHVPYENSYNFEESLPENFTGLGCRSNRTVNFYAMDAVRHSVFAERLGVDVSTLPQNPAVVIFDKENEEQYLLKENFTAKNVASFILNFTRGHAGRSLRSMTYAPTTCDNADTSVCVVEVSSNTFHPVVMDPHKDVLLFVYASWCGFCANLNHVYLSLAKYFQSARSIVFARLNGDTNDLPWEFTVESFPSLIFFPANRKADSVVFPDTIAVTMSNLIRFVLQHSTQSLRVETALGVCSKACIQKNREYAVNARYSLQKKETRLRRHLNMINAEWEHLSTTARMFRDISQKHIHIILQQTRRKLLVVDQLQQFLQSSNGVYIEHSKLRQFMSDHKLLQEMDLKAAS
ncbi:thioredoxin domain-containing protein 11-like isoform X1 [Haliotis asinina]|uniref:thioredoxin domain-containing protein 11-like isoform X1 n=1 Tax=Haliotis asinina TaxID=109174 RepID=UPI0035324062